MLLPYPNLGAYGRPTRQQVDWLRAKGVSLRALTKPPLVLVAHGHKAHDGAFEEDRDGEDWLAFPQHDDVVYWQPRSGQVARWNNRCFALGQDLIGAAATYSLGGRLHIFQDPHQWLQAGRNGIVIIDWNRTYDCLRHCPRIAVVDESLHGKLKEHFKPPRLPEIFILRQQEAVA